jgi:hypothetical protein
LLHTVPILRGSLNTSSYFYKQLPRFLREFGFVSVDRVGNGHLRLKNESPKP